MASSWARDDAPEALPHAAPASRGSRPARLRTSSRTKTITTAATTRQAIGRPSDSTRSARARLTPRAPGGARRRRAASGEQARRAGWRRRRSGARSARSAPGPPVAAVELARGADELAEGAPRPQLLEVDRAPAGEADEERDQEDRERRSSRSPPAATWSSRLMRSETAATAPQKAPVTCGADDRAAGQARAGRALLRPSRRTVRARPSSSSARSARC